MATEAQGNAESGVDRCGTCFVVITAENSEGDYYGANARGDVAPMCDTCHDNQE